MNGRANLAAWITLAGSLAAAVAFWDRIMSPYVTHEELEIIMLEQEKKRLEDQLIRESKKINSGGR